MQREELLAVLVEEIVRRKQSSTPLKVGIDGRCAPEKRSSRMNWPRALGPTGWDVLRRSADGFHHPRVRRYQRGEYSAEGYYYDAYDYAAVIDTLAQAISAGAGSILLFEGVFLFRRELNAFWDFQILLDINAATSLSRALERDTDVIGPADVVRRKYEVRYEPAWRMYVLLEQPDMKSGCNRRQS